MKDKAQLVIKVLLTINVILICALGVYHAAKHSSRAVPEKVYTQDLQAEKLKLEIEKLRYELKLYKEQEDIDKKSVE